MVDAAMESETADHLLIDEYAASADITLPICQYLHSSSRSRTRTISTIGISPKEANTTRFMWGPISPQNIYTHHDSGY
jgi:hypothetical protein